VILPKIVQRCAKLRQHDCEKPPARRGFSRLCVLCLGLCRDGVKMDEINIIGELREFVTGNTLVFLYIAISITKYIIIPIYKGSAVIKDFVNAATVALRDTGTGHALIATELKALGQIIEAEQKSKT